MPLEKKPFSPLTRDYVPEKSRKYYVKDKESWITIANKFNIDLASLIFTNFNTLNPREINWYLRKLVGCVKKTRDGKNWMFSSGAQPGYIYIPNKRIQMPSMAVKGDIWNEMSFFFEFSFLDISLWKAIGWKGLRGLFYMTINMNRTDWYAWDLDMPSVYAEVPKKGGPPIGFGRITASSMAKFKYNDSLLNPAEDWKDNRIVFTFKGNSAHIWIKDALPKFPTAKYEPILGVTDKDLKMTVLLESPETGAFVGSGRLKNGRKYTPPSRQHPQGA